MDVSLLIRHRLIPAALRRRLLSHGDLSQRDSARRKIERFIAALYPGRCCSGPNDVDHSLRAYHAFVDFKTLFSKGMEHGFTDAVHRLEPFGITRIA
jgi:hypothetical protein